MKSFKEWKNQDIHEMISEISVAGVRNWFGGSSMKVDPKIRSQIRSKLLSVWRDAQAAGMSKLEFAQQVMAAAYGAATGKQGSTIGAAQAAAGLQSQPAAPPEQVAREWAKFVDALLVEMDNDNSDAIDNVDLVRILGSSNIRVNKELKTRLHPKLQQILRDPDFADIAQNDPSELLRQIIAVAANEIVGRSQAGTMGTSNVANKLNRDDNHDQIAREMP